MTEEKCQRCERDTLVYIKAEVQDRCLVTFLGKGYKGYSRPEFGLDLGPGKGYIGLTYCGYCGQIQGKFPLAELTEVLEQALKIKVEALNDALLDFYRKGLHAKLELEYPGDPDEPERYGRLFLRLKEVKASDRRVQI